jgi:hypothetical protein
MLEKAKYEKQLLEFEEKCSKMELLEVQTELTKLSNEGIEITKKYINPVVWGEVTIHREIDMLNKQATIESKKIHDKKQILANRLSELR